MDKYGIIHCGDSNWVSIPVRPPGGYPPLCVCVCVWVYVCVCPSTLWDMQVPLGGEPFFLLLFFKLLFFTPLVYIDDWWFYTFHHTVWDGVFLFLSFLQLNQHHSTHQIREWQYTEYIQIIHIILYEVNYCDNPVAVKESDHPPHLPNWGPSVSWLVDRHT